MHTLLSPLIVLISLSASHGILLNRTRALNLNRSRATEATTPRLTQSWVGKYAGIPPFTNVKVSEFEPALLYGIQKWRAEIKEIAESASPATFENTIASLEDTGRELSRAQTVYDVYLSTMSTPEIRKVEAKMTGPLTAIGDEVFQNKILFQRVKAIYTSIQANSTLTKEQKRLVWKTYSDFIRNGAELPPAEKARLAELNQNLAVLYTSFKHTLLEDEDTYVLIGQEQELAGLDSGLIAALADTASKKSHQGKWAVTNTRSVVEPFLSQAEDRSLREKVWQRFIKRGENGGTHDNNAAITQILQLRAERASLLGYETHAHWQLENSMARTPEHVMQLLERVWKPAVATVREEVKAQKQIADAEGSGIDAIQPWDYRFYMEKVRKARYDLDESIVKPYMQLDRLREGMFWSATKLYGLVFDEVKNLPVIHPDVRVWEVLDASRAVVGLFYFDPYARSGKRSGAWMNSYRSQEKFRGKVIPIISNNCNYIKPANGQDALISWNDAETMFHEFGHALHGLLSNVNYPSLAGTAVARDYVEFPSQLHEHWLSAPALLQQFAKHVKTGEVIPQALVKKINDAKTFNQGFQTVEYLASAIVDMKLHLAGHRKIDPISFETDTLNDLVMPHELVMRHRLPQFAHIFGSDGYSAAYYSYMWADTLTADAAEAFLETGNWFDAQTAERLREDVLMVGNSIDPAQGFRAFRGRDVQIDAFMRDRGFVGDASQLLQP